MTDLNHSLYFWLNLTPESPGWLMGLARLSSTWLPGGALLGALLALLVGPLAWRRELVRTAITMLMAWLIARGLSTLWPIPRPGTWGLGFQWLAHPPTPSFPSSHACVAVAFGYSLWAAAPKHLGRWLPLGLAVLISWSRVALGLHFPLDVLTGVPVGCLAVQIVHRLMLQGAKAHSV